MLVEVKAVHKSPRDGDGDGLVNDGTPTERPAPPELRGEVLHEFSARGAMGGHSLLRVSRNERGKFSVHRHNFRGGRWLFAEATEHPTEADALALARRKAGVKDIGEPEEKISHLTARASRVVRRGRPRGPNNPVDADGDGRVYDGTPRERPAMPSERLAAQAGSAVAHAATPGGARYNGQPRGAPGPDHPGKLPQRRPRLANPAIVSSPDISAPDSFNESHTDLSKAPDTPPPGWGEPKSRSVPLTDQEWESRKAYIAKLTGPGAEWAMNGPHDSNVKYRDENGNWTPERKQLHQKLLAGLFADYPAVGHDRKAILAGGPPGAGKSSLLKQLGKEGDIEGLDLNDTKNSNWIVINPDDFKERLINEGAYEVPEGATPAEMAALLHEESSYLADVAGRQAIAQDMNIVFDITMNGKQKPDQPPGFVKKILDPLHGETVKTDADTLAAGVSPEPTAPYNSIRAVFVDAPPEVSVKNVEGRWRQGVDEYEVDGKGQGGRAVPEFAAKDIIDDNGGYNTRPRFNLQREAERGSFDDVEVFNLKDVDKETGSFKGFDKGFTWPGDYQDMSDEDLTKKAGELTAEVTAAKGKTSDPRDDTVQKPLAELAALRMERARRERESNFTADTMGALGNDNLDPAATDQRNSDVSALLNAKGIAAEGRPDGAGTPEDPIAVGDDLDKAVELIAAGKSVRLEQPDQVATLVQKLADIGREAEAKGEAAPTYDLCKVTVKGTNLFCHDSKGIPRIEMPQLSGQVPDAAPAAAFRKNPDDPTSRAELRPAFSQALMAAGIASTDKTMPASHLRATQSQLDGVQIGGMVEAARQGKLDPGGRRIFVTRDGYILDGHHGWAAQITLDAEDGQVDGNTQMDVTELDLDIGQALDFANAFTGRMGVPKVDVGANNPQRKPLTARRQPPAPKPA